VQVTSTSNPPPQRIGRTLQPTHRTCGCDVLEEPQLSTGSQHPTDLRQRHPDVPDRTEHERGDHVVTAVVRKRQCLRLCGDHGVSLPHPTGCPRQHALIGVDQDDVICPLEMLDLSAGPTTEVEHHPIDPLSEVVSVAPEDHTLQWADQRIVRMGHRRWHPVW